MNIETEKHVETTRRMRVRLTGRHLIELLNEAAGENIPFTAEVYHTVPDDCAPGEEAAVDAEYPVVVEWREKETTNG